jgi:C4-type Zn-finger protein
MGECPCPRCKIKKRDIWKLGTPEDMASRVELKREDDARRQEVVQSARKLIYEDGYVVNSKAVEDILKPESLVPTVVII